MGTRFAIALLCLLSFGVELVLDSSTSFVRAPSIPATTPWVQADSSSASTGVPTDAPSDTNESDFVKLSTAAHAGHVSSPVVGVQVLPPVSRLMLAPLSFYQEPGLSSLQRPPSV